MRALAFVCVVAGCSFPFDDESTVKDLRVLAVQAQPPEILVDIPQNLVARLFANPLDEAARRELFDRYLAQIAPFPIEMRPLVVDPAGAGRTLSVEMVACPNKVLGSDGGGGPGGARDTVGSTVCPRDPAVSQILPSREATPEGIVLHFVPTFEFATRAFLADGLGLALGWPINVQFIIRNGTEEVVAVKRVIYTPRIPDDPERWPHIPNANPKIPSVFVYPKRGDPKEPLTAGVPRVVPLGSTVLIEPVVDDLEEYATTVLDRTTGRPVVRVIPKETLRYAFYATAGTFAPARTNTEPSPLFERSDVLHLESTYTAPTTMPADPMVTVWIVVRDERGGSSHVVRQLQLE